MIKILPKIYQTCPHCSFSDLSLYYLSFMNSMSKVSPFYLYFKVCIVLQNKNIQPIPPIFWHTVLHFQMNYIVKYSIL